MRQVYEVRRLQWARGLSDRQIAQSLGLSRPPIADYVHRAQAAALSWPLPDTLDESTLEQLLFPPPPAKGAVAHLAPDWAQVHHELKRKGVTLLWLWQAYKASVPEGFQYSWFCQSYRAWAGQLDVVMRQRHRAGEKLCVDSAGHTVPIVNRQRGEVHEAQVFIAVLGAANSTDVEATWSQSLPDWIGSHVRAFEAFGGVPEVVVPDHLKAAVHHPHRYEPELHRTYVELAASYGVAMVPARSARPRDQAKVEGGVQIVERWMLARLRHHTFFSLAETNATIRQVLPELNRRPFQKLPGSRQSAFDTLDRPALRPLPALPYAYAEWKRVRVNIEDHVDVGGHDYSVPYALVQEPLDARLSAQVVDLFHKGQRVASHRRLRVKGGHSTVAAPMPQAHRDYAEWTPQRLIRGAKGNGVATARVVETILASKPPPPQGFRSCVGLMRLGKRDGAERREAACRRALKIGACSYTSSNAILKHGLDHTPLAPAAKSVAPPRHANIRGPQYDYDTQGDVSCEAIPLSTNATRCSSPAGCRPCPSRCRCPRSTSSASKNAGACWSLASSRSATSAASKAACSGPNCGKAPVLRTAPTAIPAAATSP